MRKLVISAATSFLMLMLAQPAMAHFGMVIPETEIMDRPGEVKVDFRFWHPMEGEGMNLAKPEKAGVFLDGKAISLLPALKEKKENNHITWETSYKVNRPGDYWFYMEPKPYWEPAEDCFIVHYTKTAVSALGKEEGWEVPLGLPMEIVPLTRPYGLYAGNSFTGKVLFKGKPLPDSLVEVEFFNYDGKKKAPTGTHVTQVVKADANGVFTFAMPWKGWWGFAALHTDPDHKIKQGGKDKVIELGGVIWLRTR